MSQLEQGFRQYMSRHPEILRCCSQGLINRRSLARYLISVGIAEGSEMESVVAMLRRFDFGKAKKSTPSLFDDMRVTIKDKVIILDFPKEKELLVMLHDLILSTAFDKGDTLKVVMGTLSFKVIIDEQKKKSFSSLIRKFSAHTYAGISEMSLLFPGEAIQEAGIVSTITTELAVHEINIIEVLTATPELLIYLEDKDVVEAFEVIKALSSQETVKPTASPHQTSRAGS